MLVCHAWEELGKAASSLAGCLNAITLQWQHCAVHGVYQSVTCD